MMIPQQNSQKNIFPRESKSRQSGLKEVSVKNNRSIDSFNKDDKTNFKENHNYSVNGNSSRLLPDRKVQSKHSVTVPSEFIQICLKPNFPENQNTLILDSEVDSRIILKIHSTQKEKHQSLEIKSKGIKIGLKAQKYRQNNKSEPKKVFDVQNLSSGRQKEKTIFQSQDLKKQGAFESKKTQRKNSPNIFVCTKNTPVSTEVGTKLKKFEQDLKKTKKPNVMKLQLETGRNDYKMPETKLKSILSLKNHQMEPKYEPLVCNDLKISPSPEAYCNKVSNSNSFSPASKFHFSYNQPLKRQQISALEKTKKITGHFIENFEMVSPRFSEEISARDDAFNPRSIEGLIPTNEMNFVLDRLCSNSKKATESVYLPKDPPKPSSIESGFYEESSREELQHPNIENKQALSLRATDYQKRGQGEQDAEESALSERRNNVFKTNQKTNGPKGKIQSLNEGAKTIITKYDSSQKRSIVDESIIIFQCSKDLKQSFTREVMDTYATRYRGSLGVETLIKQNQEEQLQTNEQNSDLHEATHELNGFQNILFNSNSNNGGKLRKSYSIKEIEASIKF